MISFALVERQSQLCLFEFLYRTYSQISDDDNVELKTDEELRSEGGSAHEFSPAFEKQMKKLIRENQKQQFTTYRKKFRSRIRIAILAAILVCAAMMFSVSAFRTSIINFIFNSGEKSSTFTFNDVSPSISDTFDKYLPTYIPQGFAIDSIREIPKENIYIQLTNGNGTYYEVQCELHSSHLSIDTENGQITELKINNAYVTISERKDRIIAIYTINNIFYSISGNITKDVIIKILESIP